MALATYSDLQTAMADWLVRTDLTARIPDFILLCEAELNRRLEERRNTTYTSFTISSEFMALPSDYAGEAAFYLTSTTPDSRLTFVDADTAGRFLEENYTAPAQPRLFSIIGSYFQFIPAPDTTYTARLVYQQSIPPLASNATNWVLQNHPDAYLYGSLIHSAPFLKDDTRVVTWSGLYERAMQSIEINDSTARFGDKLNAKARPFG